MASTIRSSMQLPSGASVSQKARHFVFGVVHSMAEGSKRRVTTRAHVMYAAAVVVDAVQLLSLALRPEFGWSSRDLQWLHDFSIIDILLPNADPSLFNFLFASTIMLVWGCAACAVYVGHMFRTGVYKHILPMKFLRFFVTMFVTAGFIPTLQIVFAPLVCDQMKHYNGAAFECGSVHAVLFIMLSLATLSVLLPMGLIAARFFHDSNPNSAALHARVNGREMFYTMAVKIVLVVAAPFSGLYPGVAALLYCLMQAGVATYIAITLPYYDRRTNYVRGGIMGWSAFLALGGLVASSLDPSVSTAFDLDTFTLAWLLVSPVAAIASGVLPVLKYRSLETRLSALRYRMERDLLAAHAAAQSGLADLDAAALPGPVTEVHDASDAEESDSDAGAAVSGTKPHSVNLPRLVRTTQAKRQFADVAAARDVPKRATPPGPTAAKAEVLRTLAQAAVTTYYQSMSRVLRELAALHMPEMIRSHTSLPALASYTALSELEATSGRASSVSRALADQAYGDASDDSRDEEDGVCESSPYFGGVEAREVELLVRVLLSRPENRRKTHRRLHSARQVPSTAGLSRAMWLFAEGIQEYADDAVDIGTVRVCWMMYLHTYTGDLNLVLSALEVTNRERLGIDGQFEVFTRMRTLQQLRQSRDLGSGGTMNMSALVTFRKHRNEALQQHVLTLRQLRTAFSLGIKIRSMLDAKDTGNASVTNQQNATEMIDKLGALVNTSRRAAAKTEALYLRILTEHSDAPRVVKAFGMFCKDVLGNPNRAARYVKGRGAAKRTDASQRELSVESESQSSRSLPLRGLKPKPQAQVVIRMDQAFQLGIVVVLGFVIAMLVVMLSAVWTVEVEWDDVHDVCTLRTLVVESALHARNLHIDGGTAVGSADAYISDHITAERSATLATVSGLSGVASALYRQSEVTVEESILHVWEDRAAVDVSFLLNDGAAPAEREFLHRTMSMWDVLAKVRQFGTEVARVEVEQLPSLASSTAWRFLIDNNLFTILPRLDYLSKLYQLRFASVLLAFELEQGAVVAACTVVLIYIGVGVFGKASRQVKSIKLSLGQTLEAIPAATLVRLHAQYASAYAAARRLALYTAKEDDGAESPRELDDVSLSDVDGDRKTHLSEDGAGRRASSTDQTPSHGRRKKPQRSKRSRSSATPKATARALSSRSARARESGGTTFDVKASPDTVESTGASGDSVSSGSSDQPTRGSSSAVGAVQRSAAAEDGRRASWSTRSGASLLNSELMGEGDGQEESKTDDTDAQTESTVDRCRPPLSTIVAAAPTCLVAVDGKGFIVFANDHVAREFGYTADALVGRPVSELYVTGFAPKPIPSNVARVVETRALDRFPLENETEDPSERDRESGLASTPVVVRTAAGERVDALQRSSWVCHDGEAFQLLSLAAVARETAKGNIHGEDDDSGEDGRYRCNTPTARAFFGLVFIGALLAGAFGVTVNQFLSSSQFAHEIDEAGRLRLLVHEVAFAAQELIVGDMEMTDAATLVAYLDTAVTQLEDTRHALRFGGTVNGVSLPGSANRYAPQDALQFDTKESTHDVGSSSSDVVASALGLDSLFGSFVDHALALVHPFRNVSHPPTPVGADRNSLDANVHLAFLVESSHGNLDALLERSVELYIEESRRTIESVIELSAIAFAVAVFTLLLVYFGVFRNVAGQMLMEARRNEEFLELLPPKVARLPSLAGLFVPEDVLLRI